MTQPDKHNLYHQTFVVALPIPQVAFVDDAEGVVEELQLAFASLRLISLAYRGAYLKQFHSLLILAHEDVSQMAAQPGHEMRSVESFGQDFVEYHHDLWSIALQHRIHYLEIIIVVENIEILNDILVLYVVAAEANNLIECRERVTHSAVGLLGYHVQSLGLHLHVLRLRHILQMPDYIGHTDAVEVINLTT